MRKIILDCGSHLGESVKKFKNKLGKTEYEFYMFEPNLFLFKEIDSNPEFVNCKKFNVAVSNKAEIVKFWGCTKNKRSVGSTLEKSKANWDNITEEDYVNVQTIDLSEFIMSNFSKDDYIVLKLDIEGSEYDVLDKLLDTNVISYVNELHCEFHSQWLSPEFKTREFDVKVKLNNINLSPKHWNAL